MLIDTMIQEVNSTVQWYCLPCLPAWTQCISNSGKERKTQRERERLVAHPTVVAFARLIWLQPRSYRRSPDLKPWWQVCYFHDPTCDRCLLQSFMMLCANYQTLNCTVQCLREWLVLPCGFIAGLFIYSQPPSDDGTCQCVRSRVP